MENQCFIGPVKCNRGVEHQTSKANLIIILSGRELIPRFFVAFCQSLAVWTVHAGYAWLSTSLYRFCCQRTTYLFSLSDAVKLRCRKSSLSRNFGPGTRTLRRLPYWSLSLAIFFPKPFLWNLSPSRLGPMRALEMAPFWLATQAIRADTCRVLLFSFFFQYKHCLLIFVGFNMRCWGKVYGRGC